MGSCLQIIGEARAEIRSPRCSHVSSVTGTAYSRLVCATTRAALLIVEVIIWCVVGSQVGLQRVVFILLGVNRLSHIVIMRYEVFSVIYRRHRAPVVMGGLDSVLSLRP
jgi:hypothetical protein